MAQPYLRRDQAAVIRDIVSTLINYSNVKIVESMDWCAHGQPDVCREEGDILRMTENGQRYHTMAQELNRRHKIVTIILDSAESSPTLAPAQRAFAQRLDDLMTPATQKDALLGDAIVAVHRSGGYVREEHYALAREIDATTARFLPGS